jgi:hypothetical protein
MLLNVGQADERQATEVGFSLHGVSDPFSLTESPENLLDATATLYEGALEPVQFFADTFLVTGGFGPVFQGRKHSLLVCWMTAQPSIPTEAGVHSTPITIQSLW